MTTQICISADRYAPNKRWHIDTVLRVLKLAGNFVRDEILSSFLRLVATSSDLQAYTTQKLYSLLQDDISQEALTLAGTWTIGEYGDLLLSSNNPEAEELVGKDITPKDLVTLLESISSSTYATTAVSEYIVTALVKLTARFADSTETARIRKLLQKHASSLNVELQQRAVEYGNLFDHESVRQGVLERMPPPEIKEENRVLGPTTKITKHKKKKSEAENLLDLLGDDTSTAVSTNEPTSTSMDLLQDLFTPTTASNATVPTTSSRSATNDILDLFGSSASQPAAAPAPQISNVDLFSSSPATKTTAVATSAAQYPLVTAFTKADLLLTMQPSQDSSNPGLIKITAKFKNNGDQVSELNLQAAVPKSMKLQMQPLTSTELLPEGTATQAMRINAPAGVSLQPKFPHSFTDCSRLSSNYD